MCSVSYFYINKRLQKTGVDQEAANNEWKTEAFLSNNFALAMTMFPLRVAMSSC